MTIVNYDTPPLLVYGGKGLMLLGGSSFKEVYLRIERNIGYEIPLCVLFYHRLPSFGIPSVCVEVALPLSSTFNPCSARYLLNPVHGG